MNDPGEATNGINAALHVRIDEPQYVHPADEVHAPEELPRFSWYVFVEEAVFLIKRVVQEGLKLLNLSLYGCDLNVLRLHKPPKGPTRWMPERGFRLLSASQPVGPTPMMPEPRPPNKIGLARRCR